MAAGVGGALNTMVFPGLVKVLSDNDNWLYMARICRFA